MIIKILNIQKDTVLFSSKHGDAYGKWKDNLQPKIKDYYVELDYNGIISSSQISISNIKAMSINSKNNNIQLTGKVYEYEENYLSIQIGDSFVNFETDTSIDIKKLKDSYVTISIDSIDLYDEHVI